MSRGERLLLVALLAAGAFLRIHWNDVEEYSPADEQLYASYSAFLHRDGFSAYPRLVRHHLEDRTQWEYPSPLRWGYFALSTAACHLRGECDRRTLAWLSTAAGILVLLLAAGIGLDLLGPRPALLATALAATSPLQLALGRRALQDEVFCAAVLAALWAFLKVLEREDGARVWRYAVAVALATTAFAIKEAMLLVYPALAALFLVRTGQRGFRAGDIVLFGAPPLLFLAGFLVLSRSPADLLGLLRLLHGQEVDYVTRFQSGPPHRPLFDLFLLAPLVSLAAAGGVALVMSRLTWAERGARDLALVLAVLLLVFALPMKNLRFVVMADPVMRLLGAWAVTAHLLPLRRLGLGWLLAVAVANGAVELWLFHAVFIAGEVYDPVTYNLLKALRAIP